jgi:uncharacterized protein (UPF0335 family)
MARRNRKAVEPKIGENGSPLTADRKKQLHGYISEYEVHQRVVDREKTDQALILESAKDAGFDVSAIRAVIKDRKIGRDKVAKRQAVIDVYKHALGELADMPLGQAAINAATVEFNDDTPRQADRADA